MAAENTVTLDENGLAQVSGILTVFNFEAATGLYTGSSQEYVTQGVGIPANSTTDAPPGTISGKVSVYRGGRWQQIADHRGETVYSKATGEAVTVAQPGEYPDDTTLLKPATPFDKWGGGRVGDR